MEKMTPEFIGLLVLAAMQIANFWFHAAKHKRDEDSVKRAEMKETEMRLEKEISRLKSELKTLESKMERTANASRDEFRLDLSNLYERLNTVSQQFSAVKATMEHVDQRMIRMEAKLDNLKK